MRKQKTVNVQLKKKFTAVSVYKNGYLPIKSLTSLKFCLSKCFKFQSDIYLGKAEVADGGDGGLSGK
jgi:hypothetical protein